MLEHAARITANSITTALRGPWRLDGFDARGNQVGPTSPFRLTANPPAKPPSVFIERYLWSITDPDIELHVPALSWLLTEHAYLIALSAHPMPARREWRYFLQGTALPFRRARNRHGNAKWRRSEACEPEAAAVALSIAAAARVRLIPSAEYRHAFAIDAYALPVGA